MSFSGKVAVVTGSSSGIGFETAKLLAQAGCNVVITARRREKLEEAKQEIEGAAPNSKVLLVAMDVSKEEDVKELFSLTDRTFGKCDILVANAGVNGVWAPIEELSVKEFDATIATNLRGTFMTIKYALPLMKKSSVSKGSIIIVSSINGNRTFSNTGATAYSASKAAQAAMGRMLALELAKYQIRVNSVCPGAIDTNIELSTEHRNLENIRLRVEYPEGLVPLTKDHKAGKSIQVARTIKFLAGEESDHVTGTELFVDGAESLFSL